jgi:prolyl-tRNA editing enzyme YbaK/EbsC (Cys-tRNA(Pro) deacylase)
MHAKVVAVQEALHSAGVETQVRELPESTRTAPEAAAAVGVGLAQIVKSLVFLAANELVVALVSGANRASVDRMEAAVGSPLRQADARTVKERTGYAIGGVAPVGQPPGTVVLIDEDLLTHDVVWAAAGTPRAVFPIAPDELVRVTGGRVLELKEAASADG